MDKTNTESGNILVSTLLLMLGMNLLAVTLVQTSNREFINADYKVIDSTNLQLAETCVQDNVAYFKGISKPSATLPTYDYADISHLYNGAEDQKTLNKLEKYSYNCDVENITAKSIEGKSTGVANNISMNDYYGSSGDLSPTYYYRVDSSAEGPRDSEKQVTAILAVEY